MSCHVEIRGAVEVRDCRGIRKVLEKIHAVPMDDEDSVTAAVSRANSANLTIAAAIDGRYPVDFARTMTRLLQGFGPYAVRGTQFVAAIDGNNGFLFVGAEQQRKTAASAHALQKIREYAPQLAGTDVAAALQTVKILAGIGERP